MSVEPFARESLLLSKNYTAVGVPILPMTGNFFPGYWIYCFFLEFGADCGRGWKLLNGRSKLPGG